MIAVGDRHGQVSLLAFETSNRPLTIPVLVNHHDGQEDTQSEQKYPIDVVLDFVTDRVAERQHDDNTSNVKEEAKSLKKRERWTL